MKECATTSVIEVRMLGLCTVALLLDFPNVSNNEIQSMDHQFLERKISKEPMARSSTVPALTVHCASEKIRSYCDQNYIDN